MGSFKLASLTASLAVLLGSLAWAQSSVPAAPTPLSGEVANEIAHLRQAYAYLESGDHDYKGHRAKALHAVGAACKALGLPTKGDGKNKEAQRYSDNLLVAARNQLALIEPQAKSLQQDKVLEHIHTAMHEIDLAIEVAAGDGKK